MTMYNNLSYVKRKNNDINDKRMTQSAKKRNMIYDLLFVKKFKKPNTIKTRYKNVQIPFFPFKKTKIIFPKVFLAF